MIESEINLITKISHSFERPEWPGEIEKGHRAFCEYLMYYGKCLETREIGRRMKITLEEECAR